MASKENMMEYAFQGYLVAMEKEVEKHELQVERHSKNENIILDGVTFFNDIAASIINNQSLWVYDYHAGKASDFDAEFGGLTRDEMASQAGYFFRKLFSCNRFIAPYLIDLFQRLPVGSMVSEAIIRSHSNKGSKNMGFFIDEGKAKLLSDAHDKVIRNLVFDGDAPLYFDLNKGYFDANDFVVMYNNSIDKHIRRFPEFTKTTVGDSLLLKNLMRLGDVKPETVKAFYDLTLKFSRGSHQRAEKVVGDQSYVEISLHVVDVEPEDINNQLDGRPHPEFDKSQDPDFYAKRLIDKLYLIGEHIGNYYKDSNLELCDLQDIDSTYHLDDFIKSPDKTYAISVCKLFVRNITKDVTPGIVVHGLTKLQDKGVDLDSPEYEGRSIMDLIRATLSDKGMEKFIPEIEHAIFMQKQEYSSDMEEATPTGQFSI